MWNFIAFAHCFLSVFPGYVFWSKWKYYGRNPGNYGGITSINVMITYHKNNKTIGAKLEPALPFQSARRPTIRAHALVPAVVPGGATSSWSTTSILRDRIGEQTHLHTRNSSRRQNPSLRKVSRGNWQGGDRHLHHHVQGDAGIITTVNHHHHHHPSPSRCNTETLVDHLTFITRLIIHVYHHATMMLVAIPMYE